MCEWILEDILYGSSRLCLKSTVIFLLMFLNIPVVLSLYGVGGQRINPLTRGEEHKYRD